MKWMIASDIHGSEKYCAMMANAFEREGANMLLLLGDLLYHGPRNDLPEGYAPKKAIEILDSLKDRIVCVRGNCDGEVDQMVLGFPIMAEYAVVDMGCPNGNISADTGCTKGNPIGFADSALVYATHGHRFNDANPLPMRTGSVLMCGHTHVPKKATLAMPNGASCTYMNPGSISIPKEGSPHSYMIAKDGVFVWKNLLTGEEYTV